MLPLKATIPSRTIPVTNYALLLINLGCFLYQLSLGPAVAELMNTWGLVPARFITLEGDPLHIAVPLITSLFLHGGWVHFLGNMLYLYIFGDNVEDRLGHGRYLLFYILCGIGAGVSQLWATPLLQAPMVGASGAIAGVMGAYICLYPRAKIVTLLFFFLFVQLVEIPAFFFIAFWFLLQFFSGTLALTSLQNTAGGVAWWAHIGGFLCGAALHLFLKKRKSSKGKRTRK